MVRKTFAAGLIAVVTVLGSSAQADSKSGKRLEVGLMTRAEIKEHNALRKKTDPDFIVCKTSKVTGSLAKRERTCHTVAQWEAIAERGREYLNTLQERGQVCTSGPDVCTGT